MRAITTPFRDQTCSMACLSPPGAYTAVYAASCPQSATVATGTDSWIMSTGVRSVTVRAATLWARNSGAGGTTERPTQTSATARHARMAARAYAFFHDTVPPCLRAGVSDSTARAALPARAMMGLTPTSGSATFSAANTEKPNSRWRRHALGWMSRRYAGSIAVTSAATVNAARKAAFVEVSVALA